MTGTRHLALVLAVLLAQPVLLHAQADDIRPVPAGAAAVLAQIRPLFAGFTPNGFETRTGGTVSTVNYGLPQARNGYYHFSSDYRDIYWFTRDGRLPFSYVSREEFLRRQLSILQAAMAHERSEMERNYASIGQQFDASTFDDIYGLVYQKPIARYETLLRQPAAWLQQPTIAQVNRNTSSFASPTTNGAVNTSNCATRSNRTSKSSGRWWIEERVPTPTGASRLDFSG